MRHALKDIAGAIKQRANEIRHEQPHQAPIVPLATKPRPSGTAATQNCSTGKPSLADPLERDVLAYRYQHGTNIGAIFVAEKWLFGNLFTGAATGDSELDAVKSQIAASPATARQTFENFWSTAMTPSDWSFLATTANVTTIRLPIGYFTLGRQFCIGTPFEPYTEVYTNAWAHVKQYIVAAASNGIGTLLDLHALPGGANGDSHSGTSSHKAELWGNKKNLKLAMDCATFIARETKDMPFVVGLQLVNEAVYNASGMYEFYDQVLDQIEKINPKLNVYISDAWDLGTALRYSVGKNGRKEAGCKVVVDTHKYYCFADDDKKLNPWQIIDKVELRDVDAVKGQGAGCVVGEYSCVMDGRSWGTIQGEERKGLAVTFGKKQNETWWKGSGGSFFWTYKMAWMPGGEWGFSEQTTNGAIPAPPLATANKPDIESRLARAQKSREDLKRAALAQHVKYWNQTAPGQYFEHWRFQDGWEIGFDDAMAFFTYRLNHACNRNGADKIGLADLWVKRRELEYEALKEREQPGVDKAFFWEFGHGCRQGIRDFEGVVGFPS
ncbi:hypothetical protein ABW20_dc0109551 [Dactylellina cionopaga]|nr:hypothetical protein ABW20_dc0109551 [Dactylellina cionopaga]